MIRLLQDDRLAWRLGQAGRKRMEEFSTAVMVGQNEAFYQKCLDDFRRIRMQSAAPFWMRRFRSAALNPNRDPD
jgi:hypothetical protein